jgi:hypothetical protein
VLVLLSASPKAKQCTSNEDEEAVPKNATNRSRGESAIGIPTIRGESSEIE